MDQLNILRERADELLQNSNNERDSKKYQIIRDFLKDDACFLKTDIEHAYAILRDLGVAEERIREYYSSLIAR
jgi:negative regulator of sigma E activity